MSRLANLLSRKFIIAIGAVTALVTQKRYAEAAAAAVAYIAAEAHLDAKRVKAVVDAARKDVDAFDNALDAASVPLVKP